jgi:hypothetical protein
LSFIATKEQIYLSVFLPTLITSRFPLRWSVRSHFGLVSKYFVNVAFDGGLTCLRDVEGGGGVKAAEGAEAKAAAR